MSTEQMEKIIKEIVVFIETLKSKFPELLNTEIKDWETIKAIINFFIAFDKRTCIVDFIDTYNWDRVESFSFDDSNKILELIWYDETNVPDSDEIRLSDFGVHKMICQVQIDSVYISNNKGFPVLLVKSSYRDAKIINRLFNKGCSDIFKEKYRLFTVEILRLIKKKVHSTTVPNVNCYTISIVPKLAFPISAHDSKNFLYEMNIKLSFDRISKTMNSFIKVDKTDVEEVKDKGNRLRRDFENILKIFNLNKMIEHKVDYQRLMLGDLIGVLDTSVVPPTLGLSLEKTILILNQCSHDSGVNVSLEDLMLAGVFIICLCSLQKLD